MIATPRILLGLLLGAIASMIWGGHGVVARLALNGQGITVLDMLFCRYIPAAILLAPFAWRERAAIRALGPRKLLLLTLVGGCFNMFMFVSAMNWAPASHGGTTREATAEVPDAFRGEPVRFQVGDYQQAESATGADDGGRVTFSSIAQN